MFKYLIVKNDRPAVAFSFNTVEDRRQKFIDMIADEFNDEAIGIMKLHIDELVDEDTFEFMEGHVHSVIELVTAINPNERPKKKLNVADIEKVKYILERKAIADAMKAYEVIAKESHWCNEMNGDEYSFVTC